MNEAKNLLVTISPTPYDKPLTLAMVPAEARFFLGIDVNVSNPNGVSLIGSGGVGAPYSYTVLASFDTSGEIAPGVVLNADGTITGTPTAQGTYSFVAQVEDSGSNVLAHAFSIKIQGGLTAVIWQPTTGEDSVSYRFEFIVRDLTGTTITSGFSVLSGTLPDGLVIAGGNSNVISGTPTSLAVGLTYVTIRVNTGTAILDIPCVFTIVAEVAVTFAENRDPPSGWGGGAGSWLPSMVRGIEYIANIIITGGVSPYSLAAFNLPTGIVLQPQDLQLRGKTMDPATSGPFNAETLVVVVTDALGHTSNAIRAFFILDSQQGRINPQKNGVDIGGGNGPLNWDFVEGSNVTITTSNDGDTIHVEIAAAAITSHGVTTINGVHPDTAGDVQIDDIILQTHGLGLDRGLSALWTGVHQFYQKVTFDNGIEATGGDIQADVGNIIGGSLGHVRAVGGGTTFGGTPTIYTGITGDSDPPNYGRIFTDDGGSGRVDAFRLELGTSNASIRKALMLDGIISPSALSSGNNNNINPTGFSACSIFRATPNASGSTITGFVAPTFGSQTFWLFNLGLGTLTLANQSASSTAANRLVLGATTIALASGQAIGLWYDTTTTRWRVMAPASSSTGQASIQIQDGGVNQGSPGDATIYNFTGGISATVSSGVATLDVSGYPDVANLCGGNGEDGNCTLDGVNTYSFMTKSGNDYTLSRNVAIDTLIIATGCTLRIDTWRCWFKTWDRTAAYGKIIGTGTAGNNASLNNGGASASTSATNVYFAATGSAGAAGSGGAITSSTSPSAAGSQTTSWGGKGGAGGKGGNAGANTGAAGSAGGTVAGYQPIMNPLSPLLNNSSTVAVQTAGIRGGCGGGGGAGGAGDGTNTGGGGGSGGAGAQGVDLSIGEIVTDASDPGGAVDTSGGNGGNGATRSTGNVGGGAGGGGAGGGPIRAVIAKVTGPTVTNFFKADGGTGGTAGNGVGTGIAGVGGTGGDSAKILVFRFDQPSSPWSTANSAAGSGPSGVTGGAGGQSRVTL
jgi:hypothetical protein